MSSTGIYSGLNENSRNSSRVLRPPGGGHTDLFGDAANDSKPSRRDHGRNASSILEGTNSPTTSPTTPTKTVVAPPPVPQAKEPVPQQPKGRVPPGGFSSGLW
ncbi:jupiter microtubule associated homolog 1-like [Diabrotica virgifera virgifera]|uniref:Microtubule-associated protein Jupiter n=1 Tax=Diabrotica virgifera virgifera TaxID=50390 RepID=A0A6P7FLQ4_DIAVI|nr:jupiter microtubule associated homolog 1-like [Diabrotica virgifera virgifera]